MPGKASSDFGLYKERIRNTHMRSIKFVLVICAGTLFVLGVLYVIVHLTKNIYNFDNPLEVTIEKPTGTAAEKLMASASRREELISLPPKPFGVMYRGPQPAEFTPTTEKVTTMSYPQLNAYRHRYYPKNIQDVLGFITRKPLSTNHNPEYLEFMNSYRRYRETPPAHHRNFSENDPFFPYKPQDPGDINLLATGNFRFAPPIWSILKTAKTKQQQHQQQLYQQQQQQQYQQHLQQFQQQQPQDTNQRQQEVHFKRKPQDKPLTVTLNVFPNDEMRPHNHRYENNMEPMRMRPGMKPNRMVIHLNLYPDAGFEDINHPKESRVHKKFAKPKHKS